MADPADRLEAERTARESALARLKGHAESLKQDLEKRPVKQRIADDMTAKAKDLADEAAEIAKDSHAVIAGTLGLLALWFLRRPLAASAERFWPGILNRFTRDKTE